MITEAQEQKLAAANARTKKKQDKTNPMVINEVDGRLMPNTAALRKHKRYRVYTGDLKASLPERMKWLEGTKRNAGPRIVNSMAEADVFDVGTASADELVMFGLEQFGLVLNESEPLKVLRKRIMDAAAAVEAGTKTETADDLS